jgi:hypothetical protein
MRRVIAQSLEGSRFGVYLATLANFVSSLVGPKRAKTGGSRECPIGSQLYGPGINGLKAMGKCIAMSIRGSRPLRRSLVGQSAETIVVRSCGTR